MNPMRVLIAVSLALALPYGGALAATEPLAPAASAASVSEPGMTLNAMSFADFNHGWIVGDSGLILCTQDGGATWHRQYAPTATHLQGVHFISATHGWAVGDYGTVLRTTDGGLTWVLARGGTSLDEYLVSVCFADSSSGWATGGGGLVLHTTDGGVTWTRQQVSFAAAPPLAGGLGPTVTGVSCVSPTMAWICTQSRLVGDGYSDLHIARTTNGGATWTEVSPGPHIPGGSDDGWAFWDIQFLNASTGWVVGVGVMRTDSGGNSWTRTGEWATWRIDMLDASRGVACSPGGVSTSENGGSTWTPRDVGVSEGTIGGPMAFVDVARPSPSVLFSIANPYDIPAKYISRSGDGGVTWKTREADWGNVDFLGGPTRYETAVEISRAAFDKADTVLLATGQEYPDALTASGLSGVFDAPVLLTRDTLPAATLGEVRRLGASEVIVIGGTGAVPAAVEAQLAEEFEVERIGGIDRYETAELVAERLAAEGGATNTVFVARGDEFADALSAAPLAAGQKMPVLLVRTDEVPEATERALGKLDPGEALVVGSSGAVSDATMAELDGILDAGTSVRVADGFDRYDTSAKLAQYATARGWVGWKTPGIATGAVFPDGLVGGAVLGHTGNPLLLVRPDSLPVSTRTVLEACENDVQRVWIFGDRNGAVGDNVANEIASIVSR